MALLRCCDFTTIRARLDPLVSIDYNVLNHRNPKESLPGVM